MKTFYAISLAMIALLTSAVADSPEWESSYEKALGTAGGEGKKLLIVFRGPMFNPLCKRVNEEVLDGEEFRSVIGKDYVLMDVLAPEDAKREGDEKKAYKDLVRKYHVNTYPLFVLTDSAGRIFAMTNVYNPDPKTMIEAIANQAPRAELLKAVVESDAAFNADPAKVTDLSDALDAFGGSFSTIHYPDLVELVSGSENEEVRAQWEKRNSNLALSTFNAAYVSIAQRLWQIEAPSEKIELIDATVEKFQMKGEARQMMEMRKCRVWSQAGETQKMLESARAAISFAPDSKMTVRRLNPMVAYAEKRLKEEKGNGDSGEKKRDEPEASVKPDPAADPSNKEQK